MFERLYHAVAGRLVALSLFQKLAIKTLCIAVIPLILVSLLFLHTANGIIAGETELSNRRAFSQTLALLGSDLQINQRALTTFISSPQVIETLAADPGSKSVYEQSMDLRTLMNTMLIVNHSDSVFRLRVYVPDHFLYAHQRVYMFPLSDIEGEEWASALRLYPFTYLPPRTEHYIYNDTREVFSIAAPVVQYDQNNQLLGIAVMDVDLSAWRQMLEGQGALDNRLAIVADGRLVLQTGPEGEEGPFDPALLSRAQEVLPKSGEVTTQLMDGWYVHCALLDMPEWLLMEAIPAAKMEAGRIQLLLQMAVVIPLVIGFVILVTLLTSRSFTTRLQRMARAVHDYAAGSRDTRLVVGSSDVLGSFEQDLNLLFDRTNQLISDHYALGRQAQNADMSALQSQINPHFLYNTLDMLYWMCKNGEREAMQSMIVALSAFYRKSLARGDDVVRLGDELEHVRLYLAIQNQRFGDAIEVDVQVEEGLEAAEMIKLTLQPIVENAVQHGILQFLPERGRITLAAFREGPDLLVVVEDNGAGMSPAKAAALSQGNAENHSGRTEGGYAIYNVQRRLRLRYGEAYGLTYHSTQARGTRVILRTPLRLS